MEKPNTMTQDQVVRRIMMNIGSINAQNNQEWSEEQIEAFGEGLEETLRSHYEQAYDEGFKNGKLPYVLAMSCVCFFTVVTLVLFLLHGEA